MRPVRKQERTGRESFGYKIWQVAHAWQRQLEKSLSPLGLTHLQFVLLVATSWLLNNEGSPSQSRLAEFTSFDRMMVSKIIRLLEKRGLLSRTSDIRLKRTNRVSLTPEGRDVLDRALPLWEKVNHDYFGKLTGDGQARLADLLDDLMEK